MKTSFIWTAPFGDSAGAPGTKYAISRGWYGLVTS